MLGFLHKANLTQKVLKNVSKCRRSFSYCNVLYQKKRGISTEDNGEDQDQVQHSLGDKEYEAFTDVCFDYNVVHSCYIIHPYVKWGRKKVIDIKPASQLEEACGLIRTLAPWKVYDTIVVPLETLDKKVMFGSGTLDKLIATIRRDPNITAVFVNKGSLKIVQMEALEAAFGLPIYDRYKIVMLILRLHATSAHAKLQVKLAEIPFLKSRLTKIDARGIPVGCLEKRKLILDNKEQKIRKEIAKLRGDREQRRNSRKLRNYPVVAVVGYTNCGKTSLIKALTGEDSLQPKNVLFATLDVTMHAGFLPSNLEVLYVDTVGFISDIPTNLIECFIATLEDAMYADVIVHVEDLSNEDLLFQRKTVLKTLTSLASEAGVEDIEKKIITVGNKWDIASNVENNGSSIFVSSKTDHGIDALRLEIERAVLEATGMKIITINVPSGGQEMRWLYTNATVVEVLEDPNNSENQRMKVIIAQSTLQQFKSYFIECKKR